MQLDQTQLESVQTCVVVMDGTVRIRLENGAMVQNDSLPAEYQPEVMQLYFDELLVHESFPAFGYVSVNLLSA